MAVARWSRLPFGSSKSTVMADPSTRPMRVLLATDGSDDATAAVEWLRRLPIAVDREVMVVTVVVPPLIPGVPDAAGDLHRALVAEARRLADNTAAELNSKRAIGRVVQGDPREEIASTATSWDADLIVMGARGLGAIKEFLLGSVSLGVAAHAPCPVMVCHGQPRDVRRVTVALDGSMHARRALDWLATWLLPEGLHVRLLGVAEPQHYPSTAPGILSDALRETVAAIAAERRATLRQACEAGVQALRGRVTNVEIGLVRGQPAEAIVGDADHYGSDLIVVGARGLGAIKRLLLGSVSESVLRHASCPVLVVRPRATP